jgi:hypothetical protein
VSNFRKPLPIFASNATRAAAGKFVQQAIAKFAPARDKDKLRLGFAMQAKVMWVRTDSVRCALRLLAWIHAWTKDKVAVI